MSRMRLLGVLWISALVLSACGSAAPGWTLAVPPSPTTAPSASPSASASPSPVASPSASAAASPSPAPSASPTAAPSPSPTPAPSAAIVSAELPGPVKLTGEFTYTNDIITTYYVEQAVALVDMHGFVTRDLRWETPIGSQVLGYLDLDAAARKGSYFIDLPARPEATLDDVDHDGTTERGIQIFAVAYWPNLTGGPYSEGDDPSRGWPTYLASVQIDTENKDEVIGGKLVLWAPDDQQGFPTGFGDDGLLFTGDDPVGPVPAGYSVIDLDQKPFAVSTDATPALTLYEPNDAAIKDYSAMTYTTAFEALYQSVSTNWAFNDIPAKHVDWQGLHDTLAPRVAAAELAGDAAAFNSAVHDFIVAIPDGHSGIGGDLEDTAFGAIAGAGYGFSVMPLDDGRFVVVFVLPNSPADAAGIQVGAEVTAFNGTPIADAVAATRSFGTASEASYRTYQQARYLLRAPVDTQATVTFANPGGEPQTVQVRAIAERDSFARTSLFHDAPDTTFPVEFRILDSGIGYVRVNSNYDDLNLIIRQFKYALAQFRAFGIENLVIDMRFNSGGATLGLAGFLYDKDIALGQLEYYSDTTGKFEPEGLPELFYPNEEQFQFAKIALLVGPACASACELESYGFAQLPNAIVVGMHASAGIEAEVARGQYVLPEGISVQIPTGRFKNPDGSLFLEGVGVVPTLNVPVTLENLLSADDVILAAAEAALTGGG